ncbi:glycoside hydrolase family 5 protein [Vibrio sp.]|nr:glycoside hydrolase family 5 protein [Vibrio sp.]
MKILRLFLLLAPLTLFSNLSEAAFSTQKCINIGNALEAPNEGDWGVTIEEYLFEDIYNAGFDTVRIPVRWDSHLNSNNVIDYNFIKRVREVTSLAIKHHLKVIIDVHHFTDLSEDYSEENIKKFHIIWNKISYYFQWYKDKDVYFEILNEPYGPVHDTDTDTYTGGEITYADLDNLIADAITIIRKYNPTKSIIVGGNYYNGVYGLHMVKFPDNIDKTNLVGTFHYYNPMEFTHQKIPSYYNGEKDGEFDSAAKNAADKEFNYASQVAQETSLPLFLGEFGVSRFATTEERVEYLHYISSLAENIGASWCVWSMTDGFRIYDRSTRTFDPALLQALGL